MTDNELTSTTRRTALKALAGGAVIGGMSGVGSAAGDQSQEQPNTVRNVQTQGCDFGAVADETMDSVVTIRVFDGQAREFVQGSGWVVARDGQTAQVVTNWHILFAARGGDVRFNRGEWRPVSQIFGSDTYSDIAVVEVPDVPEYVEPLSVVDSPPEQGDPVAALGAPIGLEQTLTTGVVSAVNRSTTVGFQHFMYNVPSTIQMDAATNPGNSGGPLVDCNGEVVGVNFAGTPPMTAENINFAVSTSMIRRIVPEIIETGTFTHPYIGMHVVTISPMVSRFNDFDETTQGVYVRETVDRFPGAQNLQGSDSVHRETGIPVGGDAILEIDGTDVHDDDAIRNYLFEETRPGETITLTIIRNRREREIELQLTEKPEEMERIGLREPTM